MEVTEQSLQSIWLDDEVKCCLTYPGYLNEIEFIDNTETLEGFLQIFRSLVYLKYCWVGTG